jgi:chemotaxis protein CheY-P-specific phosphatase CheC
MNDHTNAILSRITVTSLKKCIEKLTRVSAGAWSIACADMSMGTLDEAVKRHSLEDGEADATAVYFEVKGELPFIAIILFDPRDINVITKCMLGYSFSPLPAVNLTGELLLSELGNIILNSFVSALSNALNQVFVPTAPRCLKGQPRYLLEAMGVAREVKQRYRIVSIKLDIQCGKSSTKSEVLGLIPEKLEEELLKIEKQRQG